MRFSYNKLFKLLIDRGINKKTLREMSGISATSVAKLGKGGNVKGRESPGVALAPPCTGEPLACASSAAPTALLNKS